MWQLSDGGRIDRIVVFRSEDDGHVPVGELRFEGVGTRRHGRFAYAASYLRRPDAQPIDPVGLPLVARSKAAAPEEVQPAFHDVGPDGWGKSILIQAFPSRTLSMPEFLAIGSPDRTGDLAFGPTPAGPVTWAPPESPLMTLPSSDDDLEALFGAAEAVDQGRADQHHLHYLLRKSADVGGARPKARLTHESKEWIAKFPSWGDRFDDPRVEAACLDVAEAAGLSVPRRELHDVAGRSVLLVERFDRSGDGRAYAYLSAGTLLGEPSWAYGETRKTYVDIADIARKIGVERPNAEIFRRWLVNAHLHNTDDHLRNHAVLRIDGRWRLSPVFDLVPHPGRQRHVCAAAPRTSPAWSPEQAADAYPHFGLSRAEAAGISEEVVAAVRRFPALLQARGVSRKDRAFLAAVVSPLVDTW